MSDLEVIFSIYNDLPHHRGPIPLSGHLDSENARYLRWNPPSLLSPSLDHPRRIFGVTLTSFPTEEEEPNYKICRC